MQMKRANKTIFLAMFMVIVFMFLPAFTLTSRADDGSGIDDGGAFDDISGIQSYECYYFDVEELGVLDAFYIALNSVGNLLWNAIKLLTKLVMMVLYVALSFDAGELLSPFISGIQTAIHDSIFETLFVLAFCGTAVILLKRMVKRDLMGAFGDIVKVVVIVVLSIALVKKSDSALSMISQVTKETSVQVMIDINDNAGISGDTSEDTSTSTKFALRAAELLWENLVAAPWESLEFAGTDPTEEDIEDFLNIANAPGSGNRDSLVANYGGAGICFAKIRTITRLACIIVYLIPFLIKCIVYIAVAAVQLIMQIITVIYILIAPVILLLALLPGYESVVGTWLKKVLETQLGILIITFLLGIIIKVDMAMYDMMDSMGGFLVVSIMQMIIMVGIYFGKDKILGMLSTAQHLTPQDVSRALGRTGDVYAGLSSAPDKIRAVREHMMTDEQKYLKAYDEKMKKSYDEQGYRDTYNQNIKYSEFDDLEDHQKALWLDMKQKEEKTRAEIAELDAPPPEELKYANAFDEGIRKNYYRKRGKELYDQELNEIGYDGLEDYQKEYFMQMQNKDKKDAEGSREAPILQQEETGSEGEDIYTGNVENGGSQDAKRVIIKKKKSELKNGLPIQSEYPNVAMDKTDDDGNVYQRRLYDENRMAEKDFDTTDHENPQRHPTGAHKHTFRGEKRSVPQPLTEGELEENSDIIQRGVNYHDKG